METTDPRIVDVLSGPHESHHGVYYVVLCKETIDEGKDVYWEDLAYDVWALSREQIVDRARELGWDVIDQIGTLLETRCDQMDQLGKDTLFQRACEAAANELAKADLKSEA